MGPPKCKSTMGSEFVKIEFMVVAGVMVHDCYLQRYLMQLSLQGGEPLIYCIVDKPDINKMVYGYLKSNELRGDS